MIKLRKQLDRLKFKNSEKEQKLIELKKEAATKYNIEKYKNDPSVKAKPSTTLLEKTYDFEKLDAKLAKLDHDIKIFESDIMKLSFEHLSLIHVKTRIRNDIDFKINAATSNGDKTGKLCR